MAPPRPLDDKHGTSPSSTATSPPTQSSSSILRQLSFVEFVVLWVLFCSSVLFSQLALRLLPRAISWVTSVFPFQHYFRRARSDTVFTRAGISLREYSRNGLTSGETEAVSETFPQTVSSGAPAKDMINWAIIPGREPGENGYWLFAVSGLRFARGNSKDTGE